MEFELERSGACGHLIFFVDLLDEHIDGFAGLNSNIFIIVFEHIEKNIEETGVMFGRYQLSFQQFQDGNLLCGLGSSILEHHLAEPNDFFLEVEEITVALLIGLVLLEIFLDFCESCLADAVLYIMKKGLK